MRRFLQVSDSYYFLQSFIFLSIIWRFLLIGISAIRRFFSIWVFFHTQWRFTGHPGDGGTIHLFWISEQITSQRSKINTWYFPKKIFFNIWYVGRVLILEKLQAEACNFTKINTPPCYIPLESSYFWVEFNLDKKSFNFESVTSQRSKISSCNIAKKQTKKKFDIMPFLVHFLLLTGDRYQRSFTLLYSKTNTLMHQDMLWIGYRCIY